MKNGIFTLQKDKRSDMKTKQRGEKEFCSKKLREKLRRCLEWRATVPFFRPVGVQSLFTTEHKKAQITQAPFYAGVSGRHLPILVWSCLWRQVGAQEAHMSATSSTRTLFTFATINLANCSLNQPGVRWRPAKKPTRTAWNRKNLLINYKGLAGKKLQ